MVLIWFLRRVGADFRDNHAVVIGEGELIGFKAGSVPGFNDLSPEIHAQLGGTVSKATLYLRLKKYEWHDEAGLVPQ